MDTTRHNESAYIKEVEAKQREFEACKELDTFLNRLKANYNKDTQKIEWPSIINAYTSPHQKQIVDLMKDFAAKDKQQDVKARLNSTKTSLKSEVENLKKIDSFISDTLKKKRDDLSSKKAAMKHITCVEALDTLIQKSKSILENWNSTKSRGKVKPSSKKQPQKSSSNVEKPNKVIIKTSKNLPPKKEVVQASRAFYF
jgi:hypothetical protein